VWYFFCKKTGRGDLGTAREFVEQYLAQRADRPDLLNEEYAGYFSWMEGRLERAKELLQKAYRTRTSVSAGVALAIIADDEHDAARRQEFLAELTTRHMARAPKSLEICKRLSETVLDPAHPKPVDLAEIDRLIANIPEEGRGNAEFFVARFLKNHADPEVARKYLDRCIQSRHTLGWYRALSREAIKALDGR
jgi:hypothetical protein